MSRRAARAAAGWLWTLCSLGLAAALAAQAPAPEPPPAPLPASLPDPDAAPRPILPTGPPEAAPSAVAAPPAPPQPGEPAPGRITFELPVGGSGGGTVAGSADRLETSGEDEAVLEGNVEVKYRDLFFRADRVQLHRSTGTMEAEGDVLFDQGSRRIGAVRVDFDLGTRTGTFWNASAYMEPDIYFDGAVVAKTGEDQYEVTDGVFTSCTGDPTPDWSLRTSSADVDIGGYAHVRNARVRAKKLPLFYWPWLVWPAKTDRTSGLLIPNFGYSEQRGASLGMAYYQVLGPSADGTLYLDGYTEGFAGAGAEVRYRPTEGTAGKATLYFLRDEDRPGEEWRARFDHTTSDLPWGLRGVVAYEDYSDYDFFREFERAEQANTRRFIYSNAFVSGNWGAHSLNLLADQRETFLSGTSTGPEPLRSVMQRQLPEINYRLNKLRLGASRVYLSVDSTASYLQNEQDPDYDVSYGRFDLAPLVTVPLRVAPWMSIAMSAGGRVTWWGETVPESRLDPVTNVAALFCGDTEVPTGTAFCGDSLDRLVPQAALDLIGPSISRIYDGSIGRFGKFKHIVEPRWTWRYSGTFDEQPIVPRFDEIDRIEATNAAEFALVNRVLAKPSDPASGGAAEVLSFELAQAYSFDEDQPLQRSADRTQTTQEGPLVARLRFNPRRDFSLQARVLWSTLFEDLASTSLSAHAALGRVDLDLTWFTDFDPEFSLTQSDQARLGFAWDALPQRLRFAGQVNYDIEGSQIQQQRYFVSWTSQCWAATVEAREQVTRSFTSRDYRFLLSLKNVGTFLDLTTGDSTTSY